MSYRKNATYAAPDPVDTQMSTLGLSQEEKNCLWRYIKSDAPETLAFLNDPMIRSILANTGATPVFDNTLVKAALGYLPSTASLRVTSISATNARHLQPA